MRIRTFDVDSSEFNDAIREKREAAQNAMSIRSQAEIEAEIEALKPLAWNYDTDRQSNDACLAAGAHDALRWVLGLAENSISENLKAEL